MILDNIAQSRRYENLHPSFKQAFDYLKSLDFNNLPIGKIEIEGKNLFIGISESKLKSADEALLEAHNEYIDIQLPVSKAERFGWGYRKNLKTENAPFDASKDIIFYKDKPSTFFDVVPGDFVIFFPEDAHAPCIGDDSVLKIVVKIKLN